MEIAVVGGGINGLCSAWRLAQDGHAVSLFERDRIMLATSRASTKLLHGGLRYLEQGHFRLVREALGARAWWLREAPHLARPLSLVVPCYADSRRPWWKLRVGLWLYDRLAAGHGIGSHARLDAVQARRLAPGLKGRGLLGALQFFDGQMDDYALGLWVASQARASGVSIREATEVETLHPDGTLGLAAGTERFDWVVNVAGPWAERLLDRSGIEPRFRYDLIRGSHLLLDRPRATGLLLEVPWDRRVFFVLPYQGRTLIGTTEVRQGLDEPVTCSSAETDYLLAAYNAYFDDQIGRRDVAGWFSGLRPVVRSATDPSRASRDFALDRQGRILSVFGGKWTTAPVLARRVCEVTRHCRHWPVA